MKVKLLIVLLIAVAGLYACNKANQDPAPDTTPSTYLNVVNGTTTDTLNFYLNGTRQNATSSIYSGGSTGYLTVASGTDNYQFKKFGQSMALFSISLSLDTIPTNSTRDTTKSGTTITQIVTTTIPGYSLFIGGETLDNTFLIRDTLVSNSNLASVRFVHTSADAGPLDITVGDSLSFKNVKFKSVSPFKTVSQGTKTVSVYVAGQTTPVATQRIIFTESGVYTLYVRGLPAGTGKSILTIGSFVNEQ